jgi:hypothetical protein
LFGELEGQEFFIEKEKLEIIKKHLDENFGYYEFNKMMIDRLQQALDNNQKINRAEACFYFHELKEAELMERGYSYQEAHNESLQYYNVSNYSLYHPDVILACSEWFNSNYRKFWGIE